MEVLWPVHTWVWQGSASHFILGPRCLWHLSTVVGPWLVSTVGELRDSWNEEIREVGPGRMYETMVFRHEPCEHEDCGEVHQRDGGTHAAPDGYASAQTRAEAYFDHMRLCELWSTRAADFWAPPEEHH